MLQEYGSGPRIILKATQLLAGLDLFDMPKIMSYTPGWLSNPSLGHQIFTATEANGANAQHLSLKAFNESIRRNSKPGPRRTIARRGTEVFVAIGKELRWADLVYLKESWEEKQELQGKDQSLKRGDSTFAGDDVDHAQGYRVSHHGRASSNTTH